MNKKFKLFKNDTDMISKVSIVTYIFFFLGVALFIIGLISQNGNFQEEKERCNLMTEGCDAKKCLSELSYPSGLFGDNGLKGNAIELHQTCLMEQSMRSGR